MEKETLAQLQPGESAIIQTIKSEQQNQKRLQDLGFTAGAEIQCLYQNLSGSSSAYLIHGTVLALRHTDAASVIIQQQNRTTSEKNIVLAGNPNVGKSTLFNVLTGLHQHTGNWSGKTIELASGICTMGENSFHIVDLPGCYSLSPVSRDEQISYQYLMHGIVDAIVVVCDITCLERNLLLALQLKALFTPVVLAVNCMDEAPRKKIRIDFEKLEQLTGLPVAGISAGKQQGIDNLLQTVQTSIQNQEPLRLTDSLPDTAPLLAEAHAITAQCVHCDGSHFQQDRALDRLLLGKWSGIPIMLALLAFVFWLTIHGANYPSQWLSGFFAQGGILLDSLLSALHTPDWLQSCILNGVYQTLTWVIAVMLPPMAIFFPLFTILEECGYLPRVAFHLDGCFQKAGACGKQCLTTCMAFGCNAAGVTGCRIIESPRERLIAILTNSFTPCNGRLPMLIAILTMFFVSGSSFAASLLLLILIVFSFSVTLAVSRLLSRTILSGMPSSFILELPAYRRPQVGKIILHSLRDRTLFVLLRAIAVAAPAGLLIWLLAHIDTGGQSMIQALAQSLNPAARPFGMDGVILLAFILGWPANEIVIPLMLMMYLSNGSMIEIENYTALHQILTANGWNWHTAASVLLFSLFHWPCSTTCITIRKETGSLGWTLLAILLPTATGLGLCFLLQQILRIAGLA